jgi:ribose 5-phosphate isomerase A
MKRECAEAAMSMIRSNMIVGLSSGRMIEYLIEFLQYADLNVQIVTSNLKTALLCKKHGLTVVPCWMADHIDIAFDECDQVTTDLNGLKNSESTKLEDKIIASMAKEYVLLVDEGEFVDEFSFSYPVAVEVVKEAFSFAKKQIEDMGAEVSWKMSTKENAFYSSRGNLILECAFNKVEDVKALNEKISSIPGVVDTSLFVNLATNAIVSGKNGVEILNKSN